MWAKIVAFFTAIIAFFMSLFGGGGTTPTVRSYLNVKYGNGAEQVMDFYLPAENSDSLGLFVFIHGGGWIDGDKSSYTETAKEIATNFGYATMSISYRKLSYPTDTNTAEQMIADPNSVDAFDMMDDITAAITTALKTAKSNGCNITNACTIGYSAGGHLALMYAYGYRQNSPVNIAFAVSYVGPTDFTDNTFLLNPPEGGMGRELVQFLASRMCHTTVNDETYNNADVQAALKSVSPLFMTDTAIPTLMFYGVKDVLVPISNGRNLNTALTEKGVRHNYLEFPNSGHGLESSADKAIADQIYGLLVGYAKDYFGY